MFFRNNQHGHSLVLEKHTVPKLAISSHIHGVAFKGIKCSSTDSHPVYYIVGKWPLFYLYRMSKIAETVIRDIYD